MELKPSSSRSGSTRPSAIRRVQLPREVGDHGPSSGMITIGRVGVKITALRIGFLIIVRDSPCICGTFELPITRHKLRDYPLTESDPTNQRTQ